MTRRSVLAWGAVACCRQLAAAETLHLGPNADSNITLNVRKTGLMAGKTHSLVFQQFAGTVLQNASPRVVLTIQAGSLVCQDTWLKEKDRYKVTRYTIDDMLQASQFPALRFESSSVKPTSDGYTILGELTIRDQTRPLTVKAMRNAKGSRNLWTGSATIRLTAFGLKPPTAALGSIGTEDDTELSFRLRPDGA